MKRFFGYTIRLVLIPLFGFFLLYCLFLQADYRWHPDHHSRNSDILKGTLLTGIELEGQTLIFDYAVDQYSSLESLLAASDRVLVGQYGYDGQFTPSDVLKGSMGGPFPIHFPNELTITEQVLEENTWIDVALTVPSPLRPDLDKTLSGPMLVFLRLDEIHGYVPAGDPWIADIYTNGKLATRSQLSGSHEIAVEARGKTGQHDYRKKVVYQNLSRPKADAFLNTLTLEDVQKAAQ